MSDPKPKPSEVDDKLFYYDSGYRAGVEAERARLAGLAPPWVMFSDNGKPVAILPAMRSGEVANVSALDPKRAEAIVRAANRLHRHLLEAGLETISHSLATLSKMIDAKAIK